MSVFLSHSLLPVESPQIDWLGLLPAVLPAGGAVLMVLVRSLISPLASAGRRARGLVIFDASFVFAVAVAGLVAVVLQWNRVVGDGLGAIGAFGDHLVSDGFALFVTALVFVATAVLALVLPGWCDRTGAGGVEVYVLVLLAASGAVVMAGANDLIVLFLGLETMSIALYVLAAFDLRRLSSLEAGVKYFVLGAFSSAFLLYGIALTYGATGTMTLTGIADYLSVNLLLSDAMLLVGVALMLVGLGFKVAAVPFHTWAPDVYQGAPSVVTAFMASAVKAAGFAALVRVLVVGFEIRADDWRPVVFALSCATLAVGSLVAVAQNDVKRMLAYSSIAHAGFIMVGVQAATTDGVSAVLFYLAAYAVMALGSFTVIGMLSGTEEDPEEAQAISDSVAAARSGAVAGGSLEAGEGELSVVSAAAGAGSAAGAMAGSSGDAAGAASGNGHGGTPGRLGLVGRGVSLGSLSGLAARRPALALGFTVLLLAQAGVPFTSGFVAKLSAISAAAGARSWWLAVVAMVAAVIGAFAYLRVVVAMYFTNSEDSTSDAPAASTARLSRGAVVVVFVSVLLTVALGVFPGPLDDLARQASTTLTGG